MLPSLFSLLEVCFLLLCVLPFSPFAWWTCSFFPSFLPSSSRARAGQDTQFWVILPTLLQQASKRGQERRSHPEAKGGWRCDLRALCGSLGIQTAAAARRGCMGLGRGLGQKLCPVCLLFACLLASFLSSSCFFAHARRTGYPVLGNFAYPAPAGVQERTREKEPRAL